MKVISLWQPWATLVVTGHKQIETRGWNTQYRGPILIHASKKWNSELHETVGNIGAEPILKEMGYSGTYKRGEGGWVTNLPLGAIIGVVYLEETAPTNHWLSIFGDIIKTGPATRFAGKEDKERAFGDYGPDRYGWLLSNPIQFKEPIPAKGMQGFWNYDIDLSKIKTVDTRNFTNAGN